MVYDIIDNIITIDFYGISIDIFTLSNLLGFREDGHSLNDVYDAVDKIEDYFLMTAASINWGVHYELGVMYLGIHWGCLGDYETGKEFKERIRRSVSNLIPMDLTKEFYHIEECWYNE